MGRIQARKSGGHSTPAKSDAVGNFFKGVGNSIVSSANKTGDSIKTTFTSPEAMKGYKTATNIAIGVASITPVGKALAQGAIAIADKATGGKATGYLGPQNSTVNGVSPLDFGTFFSPLDFGDFGFWGFSVLVL